MVRLLVADDHPIVVEGIRSLLRETAFEIVADVRDGTEVAPAVEAFDPDMLILDERMPGMAGLDVFREMRGKGYVRPIILFTGMIGDQRAIEAIDAGVNGIVLKQSTPGHLLQCLEEVHNGNRWIDQSLLQRALDRVREKEERLGLFEALTARENQIVALVVDSLRNPEIASRLGIAEGTVKVHLHNIYEKLGLSNRMDLVLLIQESGAATR